MRVLLPSTTFRGEGVRLAARPRTLKGAVVGFLDGWGERREDGSFGMYPLMAALKDLLTERHAVRDTVWIKKPSISKPATKEQIAELASRTDVVINGEAA
ncbi:MAG: hypothetical protein HYR51_04855 [Candidatus Rokubacteria bacterium]|nr:hypothetical protein [Candidatus Rokubacteria bacterium]